MIALRVSASRSSWLRRATCSLSFFSMLPRASMVVEFSSNHWSGADLSRVVWASRFDRMRTPGALPLASVIARDLVSSVL